MPASFDAALAARIAYGPGRLERLSEDLTALVGASAPVLLVSDRGLAASGAPAVTTLALARAGFSATLCAELAGEPSSADVDRVADAARTHGARAIVALGGGSVLDVGKLAAVVASGTRPAIDYALMATPLPARGIALVLAPTTAGTGSETTRTAVFARPDGRKVWAWGDALRADLALLDPTLTTKLPAALTAATGVDALVHAIEAATVQRANPAGTAFALHAIRLIAESLPRAVEAPQDLEARGQMQIAACLAGLAIDQAGTGVAHAIGHALGTIGKVHHGRAVGHCLRAALAGNAEAAPSSHAAVARALGVGGTDQSEAALAAACAPAYAALLDRVHLPRSLADHGLAVGDAQRLTEATLAEENAPMRDNNARSLSVEDIEKLAHAVLIAA
jgi:alcohol dehydrogenase class IV